MKHSSIRRTLLLAGTASLALASIPFGAARADDTKVAQGSAKDLGVMSISLKDAIETNFGFQGALQGAGTPNQAGIGGFLPLVTGGNSVFFLDAQANADFADYNNYSSIINTTVAGTTFSSSTRLGHRWMNSNRSWMFGVNAGYDSRSMATGPADTGVNVTNSQTVFFQQVAAGVEAVSNTWNFNAYALVPVGTTNAQLNSVYQGGALDTYGLDVGYAITPDFTASLGYYYQAGDLGDANGSGVKARLAYNLTNGLTVGGNLSYDQAFDTRISADIKYRFGANGYGTPSIRKQQPVVMPVIQALSTTPANRDVRVHDKVGVAGLSIFEGWADIMGLIDIPLITLSWFVGGVIFATNPAKFLLTRWLLISSTTLKRLKRHPIPGTTHAAEALIAGCIDYILIHQPSPAGS